MKKYKSQPKKSRLNANLIKYLNLMEGWPLAEIARFFDVSRQWIHQKNKKLDNLK